MVQKNEKKSARERCIDVVVRNTGWPREDAAAHIDDARGRLGLKYIEYRRCRMWEVPAAEQGDVYRDYLEKKRIEEEEKKTDAEAAAERKSLADRITGSGIALRDGELSFHRYAEGILESLSEAVSAANVTTELSDFDHAAALFGEKYLPALDFNRRDFVQFKTRFEEHREMSAGQYRMCILYTDWLFFCRDTGYDMDDYFDYGFYRKERTDREKYVSANFRDNLRKALNKEPGILSNKKRFLDTFGRYLERPWVNCSTCSQGEFEAFLQSSGVIFAKKQGGSGGDSVARIDTRGLDPQELLEELREKDCIAEAAIIQHPEIAAFNKSTVNTIRTVTLNNSADEIVVIGAAIRFGRSSGVMDNFHQGGMCAMVDINSGIVLTDAADRNGNRYEHHPDSGMQFRGFQVPCWEGIIRKSKEMAEVCREANRLVGWDLAVTEDNTVDVIEGNSRPGFDILQVPDMKGRREDYEKIFEGLITPEDLYNTETGYWRKKILSI